MGTYKKMKGLLFITHKSERYDYLETVSIALTGGCRQIQLRMKGESEKEIERVAIASKIMCDKYGADLYINDHVEICYKIKANGVHLGKMDMRPSQARVLLGSGFKTGGTANSIDDILYLNNEGVDYIGLGPFRYTSTKEQLSPLLGIEGYRRIIQVCREKWINIPLIAIGGITREDIPIIMETGVSGIALSSAILNSEEPILEMERIIGVINKCLNRNLQD